MRTSDERTAHEVGKKIYLIADVEPLDVDGLYSVIAGTLLWLITLLALLPFRTQLTAAGLNWIYWTCLAGLGLGLWGFDYCRRRRNRRLAREAAAVSAPGRRRADAPPES